MFIFIAGLMANNLNELLNNIEDMSKYFCTRLVLSQTMPYLFLQLGILMNITKWVYFFVAINTHRNIRHFEINMEMYAEREG